MDYRKELAKWGYNKGNSIDVEILINEILPSLFSQQERSYSEEELREAIKLAKEYDEWSLREFEVYIYAYSEEDIVKQFKKK